MDANPKVTLSDGNFMPLIGLGTLNFKPNDKSFNLNDHIMNAAKTGFTHFNINPSTPQQQQALGQALRLVFEAKKQAQDQEGQKIPDQMIQAFPRQNIFVSYKVYCTANVQKDIRAALDNIKLQYFDLVMLNCTVAPPPAPVQVPQGGEPPIQDQEKKEQSGPSLLDIWKLLQGCKEKGLIKSLGVSNFSQQILLNLVPFVKRPPTVNQIESHPYAVHRNMLQTLKKMKMVMIAYSPLLRGGASQKQALGDKVDFINQPILKELSSKYAKSIPQILLNWQICRGVAVVPKTQKLDHLNDNFTITDFQLMEEDAKKLETLDKNGKIKAYQLKNTPVWRGQDPLC